MFFFFKYRFLNGRVIPLLSAGGVSECASKRGGSRSDLDREHFPWALPWKCQVSHWHNNNCCNPGNSSVQSSSGVQLWTCWIPYCSARNKFKSELRDSFWIWLRDPFPGKTFKPLNLDNSAQTQFYISMFVFRSHFLDAILWTLDFYTLLKGDCI